jgi:hypothetical protein
VLLSSSDLSRSEQDSDRVRLRSSQTQIESPKCGDSDAAGMIRVTLQSPSKPFKALQRPSKAFKALQSPSKAFKALQALQSPSKPFKGLQSPSKPFKALQSPSKPFKALQSPSKPFKALQSPSKPFKGLQSPSKAFWGDSIQTVPLCTHLPAGRWVCAERDHTPHTYDHTPKPTPSSNLLSVATSHTTSRS